MTWFRTTTPSTITTTTIPPPSIDTGFTVGTVAASKAIIIPEAWYPHFGLNTLAFRTLIRYHTTEWPA